MNAKILLLAILIVAAYLQEAHSSLATCLAPLVCGDSAVGACTAGCAAMCPLATLLNPPQCDGTYNDDGNPIGVECVCPAACANPTTTIIPRAFLAAEQVGAVSCGVGEITNAYYDCINHKFVVSWAYEEATGCPEVPLLP